MIPAADDPDIIAAVADVDRSQVRAFVAKSPWERMDDAFGLFELMTRMGPRTAYLVAVATLIGCGSEVQLTTTEHDLPPGDDAGTGRKAPWPMIGQGSTHEGRSLAPAAAASIHRSWDLPLGETIRNSCLIGADGTIYAATQSALHAVSPAGAVKWQVPIVFPAEEPPSPALGPDGTIYVRNGDNLSAFGPDGALHWELGFPYGVLSAPTVASDGTIYVSAYGVGLTVVSPAGTLKSTLVENADDRYSTPAVRADERLAYMLVDTFGTEVWSYGPQGSLTFNVTQVGSVYGYQAYPTFAADRTLYIATDGALVALSAAGEVKWSYPNVLDNSGPALAADGTIYPAEGSPVDALNPDGTLKWSYHADAFAYGHTVAVAGDGTVYSVGDRFYQLNPQGELLSVLDLGSPVTSRIAIDDDGTAVFGTKDGVLHAR